MKKRLIASIILAILIVNISAVSTFAETNNIVSIVKNSSYSRSEIENYAAYFLYKQLQSGTDRYGRYYRNVYNIDATRYGIGSVKETKYGWEVNGTLSLYDDFGRFQKSGTFRVGLMSNNISLSVCAITLDRYWLLEGQNNV